VTPFSVVAIIAAFNEADIIGQVVGDLVGQGVGVYILDHGSTDGTVAALEPYVGHGVLAIERFPHAHSRDATEHRFALAEIIRRKEALGREIGADWFINHDADEFRESPWPHVSLSNAIQLVDALGYNAIDFELLNFWPTHDDFKPGDDVRQSFRFFERGRSWDKVQIRAWKNGDAPVDLVSSAGHDAQFPGRRIFPIRFLLRHYPIRSQAHGERKVWLERVARFSEAERDRGWHVQYDEVREGHRFIRDARTLTPYDPDVVRFELWARHRGVAELEETVDDLRRATVGLRAQLAARAAEHEQLVAESHQLRAQLAARAAEHEQLVAESHQLRAQLAAMAAEKARANAEVSRQDLAIRELARRLDELYASRSWRWMAPLRAAYRMLGGR
jgi:glycosyltransferase involved in cell wall biosynthesis